MKKLTKELNPKSVSELQKEAQALRAELATMKIEKRVKPQKDTNLIMKKQKRLAVILTLIKQKESQVETK